MPDDRTDSLVCGEAVMFDHETVPTYCGEPGRAFVGPRGKRVVRCARHTPNEAGADACPLLLVEPLWGVLFERAGGQPSCPKCHSIVHEVAPGAWRHTPKNGSSTS